MLPGETIAKVMDWEFGRNAMVESRALQEVVTERTCKRTREIQDSHTLIGGELDFRVPYTQNLEFFTALPRQGVPSKLVIFPDEGHWALKPHNSEFW